MNMCDVYIPPDVGVQCDGSVSLIFPVSTEAVEWFAENVVPSPWHWRWTDDGLGLAVQTHHVDALLARVEAAGLTHDGASVA